LKILVTGGAGFIASHLSDRLLALSHQVAIVDNLVTGKRENLPEGAVFYETDICDQDLHSVFRVERPEVVIHHAAHIDVTRSVREPAYDASINILGSLNLLECCREHGVRKIMYAGTGEIGRAHV
jgi:UDP-glucose 4-epimerase